MSDKINAVEESDLPIIEVPPELRGLSDEEIIQRSEKTLHEVSGKRKKGERRPSKRERTALKEQKAHQEAMAFFSKNSNVVEDALSDLPAEKQEMLKDAFTPRSAGFSSFDSKTINDVYAADSLKNYNANYSSKSFMTAANVMGTLKRNSAPQSAPASSSGRVLKASFGAKLGEKPKAVIVSAADLALQKAEERAKKIREALFAAKRGTAPAAEAAEPVSAAATSAEDQPIKRPRGRPRKNPIA